MPDHYDYEQYEQAQSEKLFESVMGKRAGMPGVSKKKCKYCEGTGSHTVANGKDDFDIEPCPECDGKGVV